MKKLFIHAGFPKTSSSTLQFGVLKPLHENGVINLMTWRLFEENENHNDRFSSSLFCNSTPIKRYLDLKDNIINILSDESLTAPTRLRRNNFGPNIINPIEFPKVIRKLYGEDVDYKVLFVIRNQTSLLYSQHVEEYKLVLEKKDNLIYNNNGDINLDGLDIYCYNETIKSWMDTFGKANITVILFEDVKFNSRKYFSKLSNFFEVELDFVKENYSKNSINSKEKCDLGYFTEKSKILVPFLKESEKLVIKKNYLDSNLKLIDLLKEENSLLVKYGYL